VALVIVVVEVVAGSSPKESKIRILAMIAPSFLFTVALQLLILDILRLLSVRAPITISSTTRKSILRPAVYLVIEDVVVSI
jgi:hypothetical protein